MTRWPPCRRADLAKDWEGWEAEIGGISGVGVHHLTTDMQFAAVAHVNTIYWITSLGDAERGVTLRILEDLEPLCVRRGLGFQSFHPKTSDEFLQILGFVGAQAKQGTLPLIHIDTHGSAELGIYIADSGEFVEWPAAAAAFRVINAATGNNLSIVSGACFSFNAVKTANIHQTSPFYMLLAPEHEITAGELESSLVGFYRDLIDSGEATEAATRWLGEKFRVFNCERFLAIIIARYINNSALGRQKERRKEKLITRAIADGVPNNRKNRRIMRKTASRMITPNENLIERFIPTFLAGKKPSFSVAQIKQMVIDARNRGMKAQGPYA